ncbi:MAG: hypothetical protein SVJ22_01440 [Halobacteriota archaeon]|nr:hypothetical protein [Halobacteriota archaeon]
MEISTMDFYIIMLLACLPIFAYQIKLSLFPEAKGNIVKFDSVATCFERCGNISEDMDIDIADLEKRSGRMSVGVTVKLENGKVVEAIVSPCNICMEKFTIGTKVAVNMVNGEYQVHPLMWGGA